MGKQQKTWEILFWEHENQCRCDCSHEIKGRLLLGRKVMTSLYRILQSRDNTLPTKVHPVKAMVFPVVMYGCELDYKENWVPKNWYFWTMVLEKILQSPLDCKEIQPVHPKENQSWRAVLRWWRYWTGRPLSPQQIHQKNIWMLSKFHKATSEYQQ